MFSWQIAVKGLAQSFSGNACTVGRCLGALCNMPVAPAADLTRAPPASIAVAPSVPRRNTGSSSSSSPSSTSSDGLLDCVLCSLVRTCLAQVRLLRTALTKLIGTNCLKVSAGSAGQRSVHLFGLHACVSSARLSRSRRRIREVDTGGHADGLPYSWALEEERLDEPVFSQPS